MFNSSKPSIKLKYLKLGAPNKLTDNRNTLGRVVNLIKLLSVGRVDDGASSEYAIFVNAPLAFLSIPGNIIAGISGFN